MSGGAASLFDPETPTPQELAPCPECTSRTPPGHTAPRPGGLYRLTCLQCCSDLVLSTHPLRAHAGAMLAAIDRCPGNPGRAKVSASVRRCLEKPRSPGPRS